MSKKLTDDAKLIRKAGRILQDKTRRTKGANARISARGEDVDPGSRKAKCFCAEGALCRVSRKSSFSGDRLIEKVRTALSKKYKWAVRKNWLDEDVPEYLCEAWDTGRTSRRDTIANFMANFKE